MTDCTACTPDPDPNAGLDCTQQWEPLPRGGLVPVFRTTNFGSLAVDGGFVASTVDQWYQVNAQVEPVDPNGPNQTLYDWNYSLIAPDGNVHLFAAATAAFSSGPLYPLRSLDATGILATDDHTVIMPNGTRFNYPASGCCVGVNTPGVNKEPTSIIDASGNQISISSATGAYTDTLGRVIPAIPVPSSSDVSTCPANTVAAGNWAVPGVAGVSRIFKLCYSNVTTFTDFGQAGENGPITSVLLTAVVLPDLTMWTLGYDHYGDVTRLGFPTGGSISYTYGLAPIGLGTTSSLVVKSRTVDANDGTGPHIWNYNYSGQTSQVPTGTVGTTAVYSGTTVMTSPLPDLNDTVIQCHRHFPMEAAPSTSLKYRIIRVQKQTTFFLRLRRHNTRVRRIF